jgi:hypothetical protein
MPVVASLYFLKVMRALSPDVGGVYVLAHPAMLAVATKTAPRYRIPIFATLAVMIQLWNFPFDIYQRQCPASL